jgi:hypothetical protein
LAAFPEDLTSDARLALQGELSKRKISGPRDSEALQHNEGRRDVSPATTSARLSDGEQQGVGDFVAEVLRAYHSNFWLFVKITAPAVIISTFAIITGRNEAREIARHLPRGYDLLAHRGEILEIWLANFSAFLISWMVFSFSFADICIALEEAAAGFAPSPWHCLLNVRERLGTFLRLSLVLFVLVLVAEAVSIMLGNKQATGTHAPRDDH